MKVATSTKGDISFVLSFVACFLRNSVTFLCSQRMVYCMYDVSVSCFHSILKLTLILFQFDKENDRDLWQSFITGIAVVRLQ